MSYQAAFTPIWRILLVLVILAPLAAAQLPSNYLAEAARKALQTWGVLALNVFSVVAYVIPAVALFVLAKVSVKPRYPDEAYQTLKGLLDQYKVMSCWAGVYVASFSGAAVVLTLAGRLYATALVYVLAMVGLILAIGVGEKAVRRRLLISAQLTPPTGTRRQGM